MNKTIAKTPTISVHEEDVIVLGVASVETKGVGGGTEAEGMNALNDICED